MSNSNVVVGAARLLSVPSDDICDLRLILPIGLDVIGCYGTSKQTCMPLLSVLKQSLVVLVGSPIEAHAFDNTSWNPVKLVEKEETFDNAVFPLWRCQLDTFLPVSSAASTVSTLTDSSVRFVVDRHVISQSSTITCGGVEQQQKQSKKEQKPQKMIQLPEVCVIRGRGVIFQFTAREIQLLRTTTADAVAPVVRASADVPLLVKCHLDVLIVVKPEQTCAEALAPVAATLAQQARQCFDAPRGCSVQAMHFWPDELPFPITVVYRLPDDGTDSPDLRMCTAHFVAMHFLASDGNSAPCLSFCCGIHPRALLTCSWQQ